jgi:short-subunit dehydrogenase
VKVAEKVFLLTGAGGGVGAELALALINKGARVAAIDFREEPLVKLEKLAGSHVETFLVDITDQSAVLALPQAVAAKMGQVDGLINNAGIIQPFRKVNELSVDEAARVMGVNFTGSLFMIKAFLPILLDRPEGHIVNISSMGAYAPVPGQSLYGASKAALAQLSDGLRSELRGTKVRVTLVFPGAMRTDIAANSGAILPQNSAAQSRIRMTQPKAAAQLIVEAIERERERIFIGSDAKLMNLLSRISPNFAANLIQRQMRNLLP